MRITESVEVNVRSNELWPVFMDWSGVHRFHPWVARSPLLSPNSEGLGASRRCELVDGTSIVETITRIDADRRIEMILSETPKPMTGGSGSITLVPRGASTVVTVEMDVTLGLGPLNAVVGPLMMKPMMKSRIRKMLASLEYHLKTGGKIDDKGVEQPIPVDAAILVGGSPAQVDLQKREGVIR